MFRSSLILILPVLCAGSIRTLESLPDVQITATAVDASGAIYVTGNIGSADLPITAGAFQSQYHAAVCHGGDGGIFLYSCKDGFVAKVDRNGRLVYATYLGGNSEDLPYAIAVDSAGNAYVGGYTASSDFPLTANRLAADSQATAFVTKLNPSGTSLLYSTRLPGMRQVGAITVDGAGVAYIAGGPDSSGVSTTPGAINPGPSTSAAILKLGDRGDRLIYASYLPGSNSSQARGIALDAQGNVYVVGSTAANDFPVTAGSLDTRPPGKGYYYNAFVLKLNSDGTKVLYAARPTGSCNDEPASVAVDGTGRAFLTGATCSQDYPITAGALQKEIGLMSSIAFVTVLSPDGSSLEYSTYLGGSQQSAGTSIAVDAQSRALVNGWTYDADFPTSVDAPVRCNNTPLSTLAASGSPIMSSAFFVRLDPQFPAATFATYVDGSGSASPIALTHRVAHGARGLRLIGINNLGGGALIVGVDSERLPGIHLQCVANAASGWSASLSPGELVTLYGTGLGPSVPQQAVPDPSGMFGSLLAGVRVLFDNIPAPLLMTSEDRLSAVVPFELSSRSTVEVQVERDGVKTDPVELPFVDVAPGIFQSGITNLALVLNEDRSVNSPTNRARRGSVITFWVTGLGAIRPSVPDGSVTPANVVSATVAPVRVSFFGWPADVLYAGSAPGTVAGVVQINARVPDQMGPFNYPVDLNLSSTGPYMPIRVTVAVQ